MGVGNAGSVGVLVGVLLGKSVGVGVRLGGSSVSGVAVGVR